MFFLLLLLLLLVVAGDESCLGDFSTARNGTYAGQDVGFAAPLVVYGDQVVLYPIDLVLGPLTSQAQYKCNRNSTIIIELKSMFVIGIVEP